VHKEECDISVQDLKDIIRISQGASSKTDLTVNIIVNPSLLRQARYVVGKVKKTVKGYLPSGRS
jgi:hypothetical protein